MMGIRLLILALAACYLWECLRAGCFRRPVVVIGRPVMVYLLVALLSTLTSAYFAQSWQWLLVLSGYAALLVLIAYFVQRWDQMTALLAVFAGMAVVEAGWALFQAARGALRPTGTFFNPNFLAVYLAVAWVMSFSALCFTARRFLPFARGGGWGRAHWSFWALFGLLVFLSLAIVCTTSRGGWLVLIAGLAFVTMLRFGRSAAVALAGLLLVLLLAPNPLRTRLVAEHRANPETYARWQMWEQSAVEMSEHPLGIGLGLYQYWAPRYMFPIEDQIVRYGKLATTAHNEYLQMGVEMGAVSLAVFAWGTWLLGREGARLLQQRLRRRQRAVLVGIMSGIGMLLLHAGVDSTFHEPALALLLALLAAFLLASCRMLQRNPSPPTSVRLTMRPVWTAVSVAAIVLPAVETVRLGLAWQIYETGRQAALQSRYTLAEIRYRLAVDLDPGKALYRSALASADFHRFQRTHDPADAEHAIEELRHAADLNPLDGRLAALQGQVYESLAEIRAADGSPPDRRVRLLRLAQDAYGRAVEREPFGPYHRLALGRIAFALGDRAAAESLVRTAVELEPNFLPAREWLTRRYAEAGHWQEADRQVEEIRERQHRFIAWKKDANEQQFLQADAPALEAALRGLAPAPPVPVPVRSSRFEVRNQESEHDN
jgi:O-antigen ligase